MTTSGCDMNGIYRGQVVSARHAYQYVVNGLDMFQGLLVVGPKAEPVFVDHEKNYSFGNMAIFPDPRTLRKISWAPEGAKIGEILCESRWKGDNSPQEACPRFVARKQISRLKDKGYNFLSSYEVEFAVFHKDTLTPIFDGIGCFSQRVTNSQFGVLWKFDKHLRKSGIDVERLHCDMGPGLFEAITTPKYGIDCPDMVQNMKQSLVEIGDLNDLVVSFMPKMKRERDVISGLSAHFNFSVWDLEGKNNAFFDASASDRLSAFAKHWIAGIMRHSRALCAICNPTVNCYRRLNQPFFPTSIYWGLEDRMSTLRVKNHGPYSTYFENRMPSGKNNAYLVLAAVIASGLDGVEKELECCPPGKPAEAQTLPSSLSEALDELEQDTCLMEALGKEFVQWFVKCKRDGEIAKYKDVKTDEEKFQIEKDVYFQ